VRDQGERLTVGQVQREIRLGMPGGAVADALGSPNIVTTDENRHEVWVYDRMATEVSSSSSGAGAWLLLFGANSRSSAESKSQRTLTIVIKFDDDRRVRDFAYHASTF
jgi:hypothetical protein